MTRTDDSGPGPHGTGTGPGDRPPGWSISRRAVLLGGVIGGAAVGAQAGAVHRGLLSHGTSAVFAALLNQPPSYSQVLRRREDQLLVAVHGYNLRASGGALAKIDPTRPAVLVAELGPQAIAEEALDEGAAAPGGPVQTRSAGPSRLAFEVPDTALPLPLTAAALLDWSAFPLRVVPAAENARVTPR